MKFIASGALALAAIVGQASAHYRWDQVNSNTVWEYVRESTNDNSPVTDLASNDLRCNVGGASGSGVATLSVAAGSTFTFTLDLAVYHIGPTFFYMSEAPSTADTYDGSGDWFKIAEWGPTFSGSSSSWTLQQSYSATIPKSLPSGNYLLRAEQLAIHNPYPAGIPQFYISCAQVQVTGGGNGVPSPTTKIPGHVKVTDPGYTVNVYNNFQNYTMPGPAVWKG